MQVRAAVFREPGNGFNVETLDLHEPRAGEVLVKVAAVGVCHSDWHLATGDTKHPAPAVVGHEGSGIVERVGPGVTRLRPGDKVALNWAPNCGHCFYCLHERPSLCETYTGPIWSGTMLDGTTRFFTPGGDPVYQYSALGCFAEYTVVPEICCVPMPETVPFEIAALIGCAVTTGVGATLNTAGVKPGSSVAVFGVGGVGLSAVLGARLAGAGLIIAVDTLDSRLEKAKELGATHGFLAGSHVASEIKSVTDGRGVDYAIEAAGVPAAQEQAFAAARPGGEVIFAGLSAMGSSTNLPGSLIVRQEKTIKGSYYGTCNTARDFPLYASLYQKGQLPLDQLISKRYRLEEINHAYEEMLAGATARGVIAF